MIIDKIKDRLSAFDGEIGIRYIDIETGRTVTAGNCDVFPSSGTVSLFVLVEAFSRLKNNTMKKDEIYVLQKSDYIQYKKYGLRGCGALSYMHEGLQLTMEDLYKLCTITSDNVAFNILIDLLGLDSIEKTMKDLGVYKSEINRKIYDFNKISKGIENYISVEEAASLFYRMYKGQVVSGKASREMLEILKLHERNTIMGYYFEEKIEIAHITSFDDEYVMDAGIVYADKPFVLAMAAHDTNIRNAESVMRDITRMCYDASQSENPN